MSTTNTFFPFIIGYSGDKALVDKRLKGTYQRKTQEQLLDASQYKLAFCYALKSGQDAMQLVADRYNTISGSNYSVANLERLFGVFGESPIKKIVTV